MTEKDCATCRYRFEDCPQCEGCYGTIDLPFWVPYPGPQAKAKADADQTAKADAGKPRLTLVPRRIITAIARIRMYGTDKYKDPDNWKRVEVERYRDAAFRHLLAYLDDPAGTDEESGLPHLWHLACNVAFLCEMEDIECRLK